MNKVRERNGEREIYLEAMLMFSLVFFSVVSLSLLCALYNDLIYVVLSIFGLAVHVLRWNLIRHINSTFHTITKYFILKKHMHNTKLSISLYYIILNQTKRKQI